MEQSSSLRADSSTFTAARVADSSNLGIDIAFIGTNRELDVIKNTINPSILMLFP